MISDADKKILDEVQDRLAKAITEEGENKQLALDDLEFVGIEDAQWPQAIRAMRIADGRPCLTINKMPAFIDQVVGDQRMNRPSIRVIPVDPYIIQTLDKHYNQSEYVLCRTTNKPYRNDEVYHKFIDALKDEEGNFVMPATRLHDLRHYNATMMAYYGIDIKTAANMLGDDPVTILKIYQHVQDKMNRNAAEKMGGMFKRKEDKPVVNSVVNRQKERISNTTIEHGNPLLN